ncbi:MAG: Gfo/Idh/MocA family protein [Rubrivivax sp.]
MNRRDDASPIRVGVLGLGRGFTLMVPTFERDPRVRLVAGHDPRPGARAALQTHFGARTPGSVEAVCADPDVELVYVATPHGLHAEHVALAAGHGKHVLVEKPMALTLADCTRMIAACEQAGTHLIVGHSHSFDAPVVRARALIDSGEVGAVRMIHAMQYTDFLYRPRRPEELDTAQGGGVTFSQAAHQVDIVRLLGGGRVTRVRAYTGAWDASRPTEGAYSALLGFDGGAFASLTYSGYAHYDSDELMGGIGELGGPKAPDTHRQTRTRWQARLEAGGDEAVEAQAKAERNFGGSQYQPAPAGAPAACQHFGPVIVSCDRADLRLQPDGVDVIDRHGTRRVAAPIPDVPRAEVVDELWAVLRQGMAPRHDGAWSRATLAVCLALLASQRLGADVVPEHQVGWA